MRVILFGASGMVGQGVLRECLLDAEVTQVLSIVRAATGVTHGKLREIVLRDLFDYSSLDLSGLDACFFCLGVSSAGMSGADYTHLTYDLTLAAAEALARVNPGMVFVYVSGAGTDSSEQGKVFWARVKGRTENAVMRLFPGGYAFRPAAIQPMHGAVSKTKAYKITYDLLGWSLPLLRKMLPQYISSTEEMGRAMLRVAKRGWDSRILENRDIVRAGRE